MYDLFWAGTDTSYQVYVSAVEKFSAMSPEAFGSPVQNGDEEQAPRLYSALGNVGVITIRGAMVNTESWWTRFAGMTSYESIREAVVYAFNDASVDRILLDIASPGGQVAGCEDTAKLVAEASKHKPISAFSDSSVASAAYWIASAADTRFTSKSAIWGSIGVIMRHAENSKMRTEAGIVDTIFRSGSWKGIGGSQEKLSALAVADFQEKTDYLANIFVEAVADNLNITAAYVEEKMGAGREFIGQQAVDIGLCTSVESFDAVVSKLQEAAESVGGSVMKKILNPQALAAMAAGGGALEAASTATTLTPEAAAALLVEEEAAAALLAEASTPEALAAAEAAAEPAVSAELTSALAKSDLLKEQMTAMSEEIFNLKTEAKTHQTELDTVPALKIIAASAINNMQVALGSAKSDLSAHSAADLATMHTATSTQFATNFKAGGVTKEPVAPAPKATVQDNSSAVGFG